MLSKEKKKKNYESIGSFIRDKRIDASLKQKELADIICLEYYTLISSIELGYTTIPPAHWRNIAKALKIDEFDFSSRCLLEMYPEVYAALFGMASRIEVTEALKGISTKSE